MSKKKFMLSKMLAVEGRSLEAQSDVDIEPGQPGTNSWECLLRKIHLFLYNGFELEKSGLAHLRRVFPQFTWQYRYIECDEEWRVIKLIQFSDYIWQVSWGDCLEVVTASQKGKTSHKPVFCSLDNDDPYYAPIIKMAGGKCFNTTFDIEELQIN